IHSKGVHRFLAVTCLVVHRLENHRHQRLGFAFRHVGAPPKHLRLFLPAFPPLGHPYFVAAVFARTDASFLKSVSTHEKLSFLRPKRCILTCCNTNSFYGHPSTGQAIPCERPCGGPSGDGPVSEPRGPSPQERFARGLSNSAGFRRPL